MIKLACLVFITLTLSQATPTHVYKSFPPDRKVKALSAGKTSSEKPEQPLAAVATQTETPASPAPVAAPAPVASVTACGSDPQMAYIYTVESGCRTGAYNYLGCRGLGQACPGSKLPCSDSDWTCQDNWFRSYAVARYGSISAAYAFRVTHNYW